MQALAYKRFIISSECLTAIEKLLYLKHSMQISDQSRHPCYWYR